MQKLLILSNSFVSLRFFLLNIDFRLSLRSISHRLNFFYYEGGNFFKNYDGAASVEKYNKEIQYYQLS